MPQGKKSRRTTTSGKSVNRKKGRRRKRQRTSGRRILYLILVLVGIVGVLYAAIRLFEGPETRVVAESAQIKLTPNAIMSSVPTDTPVPTPTLPAVDVNSWELRLIRYENPLGEDYIPESLTEIESGQQVDSRIAQPLKDLFGAARAADYPVYFCSGYRDYETQSIIYQRHIDEYTAQGMSMEEADAQTRLAVNYPGSSEHQSGLCADILETPEQDMEPYIGGSGLMAWLEEHCDDYGFIIRYPKDKTDITGVEYEPWHLRYVGKTAAEYIMKHGLCLEEFLQLYQGTASTSPAPIVLPSTQGISG